jgi:hypothetical protein
MASQVDKNISSKAQPSVAPAMDQMSVQDVKYEDANVHSAALKLAAAHEGEELDPAAEKRLVRKIDWALMPLVCSLLNSASSKFQD